MDSRLWRAVDLIRERRMIKGARGGTGGAHCALGFLDEVNGGFAKACREDVIATGTVAQELFPERCDVSQDKWNRTVNYERSDLLPEGILAAFNNHPLTTKEDLLLVFEKSAIKEDEVI